MMRTKHLFAGLCVAGALALLLSGIDTGWGWLLLLAFMVAG